MWYREILHAFSHDCNKQSIQRPWITAPTCKPENTVFAEHHTGFVRLMMTWLKPGEIRSNFQTTAHQNKVFLPPNYLDAKYPNMFSLIRTWLLIRLQGQTINVRVPACWRSKHFLVLTILFRSWYSNSYSWTLLIVLIKLLTSLKWWVYSTLSDLEPEGMCLWVEHRDLLRSPLMPQAGHNLEQMVCVTLSMAVWHAACMQQGSLASAQH